MTARVAALTAALLLLTATPADAAGKTRWLRDGSYVDHRGVRIVLCIRQVRVGVGPLKVWDSRDTRLYRGRCPR